MLSQECVFFCECWLLQESLEARRGLVAQQNAGFEAPAVDYEKATDSHKVLRYPVKNSHK